MKANPFKFFYITSHATPALKGASQKYCRTLLPLGQGLRWNILSSYYSQKHRYFLSGYLVLLVVLINFSCASAQERYDVTLKNDTVYNHGAPEFLCKFKGSVKGDIYSLRTLENKTEAILIIFPQEGNNIKFTGTFTSLNLQYACLYPKMEIVTLMDSYIRNKVFVKGKSNLEGLKAYCKERNLSLDVMGRKAQSPAIRDSILVANAKADALSQIKFTFHNNSAKPVRIFIGDKPKGGSGRVQIIAPHGDLNEHARKTEKIFLLNDAGIEIKSISVTDSLKRIVINTSADGFE